MPFHDATYNLSGKRFRIKFVKLRGKADGYCSNPAKPKREILVKLSKGRRERTITRDLVHEVLHACAWDMSEEWVDHTADDIVKVLYSQGLMMEGSRNGDD